MKRLLVVGAGATIEECRRSGNKRDDPNFEFPTIRNFARKLFQRFPMPILESMPGKITLKPHPYAFALAESVAAYLKMHGIPYDETMVSLKPGTQIDKEMLDKSPIEVFINLEEQNFSKHNVERLCEFVWRIFGKAPQFWDKFLYDAIYFGLFVLFTEQFGLGKGASMNAGRRVADFLNNGDAVLNLNYDIAFDLALKQASKSITYSPGGQPDSVLIFKPHGSLNLYFDHVSGDFTFVEPDAIPGYISIAHNGSAMSAHGAIIPPRLNKTYEEHPVAHYILETSKDLVPELLTFWGVGLTESDADLVDLYRKWSSQAKQVEFINPSVDAFKMATDMLGNKVLHFPTLDDWVAVTERR